MLPESPRKATVLRRTLIILVVLAGLFAAAPVAPVAAQDLDSTDQLHRNLVFSPDLQARYVDSFHHATTLEELQFAPDFEVEHANLLRLYQAFFGRAPDFSGAKYWVVTYADVRSQGVTAQRPEGHDYLGEFANLFVGQDEFRNSYGDADNAEFLTRVYDNMLGRIPDQAGYDYWLSFLNGNNADKPGVVLDKGSTVRWVTQSQEFVTRYPFGHADRSAHPSDNADCSPNEVAYQNLTISGIYRLRDGGIRELCWGTRNVAVENAWERLVEVAEPTHFSPVALLGVFQGSGQGIVAYAGPTHGADDTDLGDLWLISAQDVATQNFQREADLTMSHELSHVFTQLEAQYNPEVQHSPCSTYEAGSFDTDDDGTSDIFFCYTASAYLNQWVQEFWTADELSKAGNASELCTSGHDFISSYATTSPEEDLAESFSGYVYSADVSNQDTKFAFFDSFPELKAYRNRAQALERTGYTGSLDQCRR